MDAQHIDVSSALRGLHTNVSREGVTYHAQLPERFQAVKPTPVVSGSHGTFFIPQRRPDIGLATRTR